MSGKYRVLVNSFLYTLSALLVKAIGFLLLPVYTLFLSPEDYGITNLVNSFTQVAIFIIAFSLYSAVVRFYADYKDDREKLKRFYGTMVVTVSISGIIFVILGFIFHNQLILYFFEGISFYPIIVIALVNLFFVCLFTIHQSIMQGMQQGEKLTTRNLIVFAAQVCLNLLFICVFRLGAVGILLASLIINVIYFIYMLIDLKKSDLVTFCIDSKILKESLKYSIPIMPHNLSTHIASFTSRIFINNSGNLASVGLYGVASQFGTIVDTVQSSVNQAFGPWFYEMMNTKSKEKRKEIVDFSESLLIMYSLIYMGVGLFCQEVMILMTNERYIMAWTAIPILVVAFSIKSVYYFYVYVLYYYKKATKKIFIATVTSSLANIMIAFLLVPLYGMYGASISFLAAKIIVVLIVVIMSKKYEDIGYKVGRMLKIIIPSLLFMGAGLYFSYTKYIRIFSWTNFFYKIGVLIVYILYLYFTNKKLIHKIIASGKIQQVLKRGAAN